MGLCLYARAFLGCRSQNRIEFGCVPEYDEDTVPEHTARALAKALYRAIRDIEADCLEADRLFEPSEPLIKLVREATVGHMRAVADLAYAGGFYID